MPGGASACHAAMLHHERVCQLLNTEAAGALRLRQPRAEASHDSACAHHAQVVHRAHRAQVVLCDFLPGSPTMLTVDTSGLLALWHAAGTPCGFGWVLPSRRWQLRPVVATLQPR
jgi:hypothetical protein